MAAAIIAPPPGAAADTPEQNAFHARQVETPPSRVMKHRSPA